MNFKNFSALQFLLLFFFLHFKCNFRNGDESIIRFLGENAKRENYKAYRMFVDAIFIKIKNKNYF